MLIPGEHGTVILTLLQGMLLPIGQRFTFRENNVTVGTGCITAISKSVHVKDSLMDIEII